MKITRLTALFFCLSISYSASAATLKWRYRLPADAAINQVFAGSGGGVAVTYGNPAPVSSQPTYTLVWLDNHGRELFKKSFGPEAAGLTIIGVTRQGLTYSLGSPPEFIVVDRRGHETDLSRTSAIQVSAPESFYTNEFGVFAPEAGTSDDPAPSVVFYAYNP